MLKHILEARRLSLINETRFRNCMKCLHRCSNVNFRQ